MSNELHMRPANLKVGQVYSIQIGYTFTVIGLNNTHWCWQMNSEDCEMGCTRLELWNQLQNPVLVQDIN